jgi:cell division transport system ATP-binding protein
LENILSLKDVSVHQNNNLILSNINIEVYESQFYYLTANTGLGKTSFLKTLYAELPLLQGSATVVGFDLKNIKKREIAQLRKKLGIVFQDFQLLQEFTAMQNLEFVLKATAWPSQKITQRCNEVLEMAGLLGLGKKFPYQLSGGEQQQLCIARALLNNPKLVLADEPTGNLDQEASAKIISLLSKISEEGTAVIMASHDINIMNKYPKLKMTIENNTVKI